MLGLQDSGGIICQVRVGCRSLDIVGWAHAILKGHRHIFRQDHAHFKKEIIIIPEIQLIVVDQTVDIITIGQGVAREKSYFRG